MGRKGRKTARWNRRSSSCYYKTPFIYSETFFLLEDAPLLVEYTPIFIRKLCKKISFSKGVLLLEIIKSISEVEDIDLSDVDLDKTEL